MISPFLKKLLFARQFSMIDGKIEILGKSQVLLPSNVVVELERLSPKPAHKAIKSSIKKDISDYAQKLGSTDAGMLNILAEVFETFGLGHMEIIDLDNRKKACIVRIHNSPLKDGKADESGMICLAVLSGIFSFLFSKDVEAKRASAKLKGMDYSEYVIR